MNLSNNPILKYIIDKFISSSVISSFLKIIFEKHLAEFIVTCIIVIAICIWITLSSLFSIIILFVFILFLTMSFGYTIRHFISMFKKGNKP